MLLTNFLQKRKSVRDFEVNTVPKSKLSLIKEKAQETMENEKDLSFVIFENGKIIADSLKGKAGYCGVMINAPHYIGLKLKDRSSEVRLKEGYFLEKLNTIVVNEDLDTCWITVDQVDEASAKATFGEGGENIDYLIGFGYAAGKKLFDPDNASPRKAVNEIVFEGDFTKPASMETLEQRGLFDIFTSIRFVPNHKNSQPWRFVIKDAYVYLYMVKGLEDSRSLVDCGVIQMYFEEMAKYMGVSGKWENILEDKGEYFEVAKFKM